MVTTIGSQTKYMQILKCLTWKECYITTLFISQLQHLFSKKRVHTMIEDLDFKKILCSEQKNYFFQKHFLFILL